MYEDFYFGCAMVYPPGHLLADCTCHAVSFSTDLADTSAFSNRWTYYHPGF
jgi:hypothetical protein